MTYWVPAFAAKNHYCLLWCFKFALRETVYSFVEVSVRCVFDLELEFSISQEVVNFFNFVINIRSSSRQVTPRVTNKTCQNDETSRVINHGNFIPRIKSFLIETVKFRIALKLHFGRKIFAEAE